MAMVMELGMAGEPAVSLKALQRGCGGAGGQEASRALLNRLYDKTLSLIGEHSLALNALAEALMRSESLTGEEAMMVLEDKLSNERPETA